MTADRRKARSRSRRRGFGLVEMGVAAVLFAAIVVITAQVVAWVATDRKATARREAAARLVANVMERALTRPWPEVSTEGLAPLARSAVERDPLPSGSLQVEVTEAPAVGGRGARKVIVEVRWPDRSKVAESPVRLVSWTFEPKGTEP